MVQRSFSNPRERRTSPFWVEALEPRYLLSGVDDGGASSGDPPSVIIAEVGSSSSGTVVGLLTADVTQHTHILNVFTTQPHQFQLAVSASTDTALALGATVYDSNGGIVLSLSASTSGVGVGSVILQPGSYFVVVTFSPSASSTTAGYELRWDGESQYLGPPVLDPSGSPIGPCGDALDEFCFPDTTISSGIYFWVDDNLEPVPDGDDTLDQSWYDDFWSDWYASFVEPLISGI